MMGGTNIYISDLLSVILINYFLDQNYSNDCVIQDIQHNVVCNRCVSLFLLSCGVVFVVK